MTNINDPTPQLKLTKKLIGDYSSRDLSDVGQFLSEDFKYETFPKVPELPEEAKGDHIQKWGAILGSFTKMEVRTILDTEKPLQACRLTFPHQPTIHEVIDAPGKVVLHVRPSSFYCDIVSDCNTYL